MDFEERLTCFIDLLGFQEAVKQAKTDGGVRNTLFSIFDSIGNGEIEDFIYGGIPVISEGALKRAADLYKTDELRGKFHAAVRMEVTQFSDSIILSVPADNAGACEMLVKAVFAVKLMFFMSVGMLMRGGVAIGGLIHTKNGPLFGPAMNEAYILESKEAIYPRVVLSYGAQQHLEGILVGTSLDGAIKKDFDGKFAFDLIDVFKWKGNGIRSKESLSQQLHEIEKDILSSEPRAHSKIAYLLHKWAQVEHEYV